MPHSNRPSPRPAQPPHAPRIQDLLDLRTAEGCVGRDEPLRELAAFVEGEVPLVVSIHGAPGIGKTTLARATAVRAAGGTVATFWLEGGAFEPTPQGFLGELARQLDPAPECSVEAVAAALSGIASRRLVVIDGFERCRLIEDWLRREWFPRQGLGTRLLVVGRQAPSIGWRGAVEWRGLFHSIELGPLPRSEAEAMLSALGVAAGSMERVLRLAGGHPLALRLAAGSLNRAVALEASDWQTVLGTLVSRWLEEVPDEDARRAVRQTSVVRRVTKSLLRGLVEGCDPHDLFERLAALPFTSLTAEGLRLDDTIHEAIASHFKASDPAGHRAAREAAWRVLLAESRSAGAADLWRYTADMLYLVETPTVREIFFPSGSGALAVEAAAAEDFAGIIALAERMQGSEAARAIAHWCRAAPEAFHCVRDPAGQVVAFSCVLRVEALAAEVLEEEAATRAWLGHLAEEPVRPEEHVLMMPRLLGPGRLGTSPEQAALILHLKRHYLELRPRLRRLYAEIPPDVDFDTFLRPAGFRAVPTHPVRWGEREHATVMLDFGPESVDGWLGRLVAAAVREPSAPAVCIDEASRELVVDGQRTALTGRELEVLRYLMDRAGEAVKRGDLLDDLWGTGYEGGSNVIDVVILSLRKKLGVRAGAIETVVRYGYRYRAP
ncbi:MAG TPA: winged helix-turn-helix domain-containing protein [Steroidobacteraceae bacterium]|nr:winged helix-turn-helix domain-containing protein [Steroidobacteraceae bacterium]